MLSALSPPIAAGKGWLWAGAPSLNTAVKYIASDGRCRICSRL